MTTHGRWLITAGWLAAMLALFRFWELTGRFPGLAIWSCIALAGFAATLGAVRGAPGMRDRAERARLITWAALIVAALAGHAAFPLIEVGDAMVRTSVFVGVLDTVVPLWILVRALMAIWRGPARIVALAAAPAVLAAGLWLFVVAMPGSSLSGALPALTAAESLLAVELERDVRRLASGADQRNFRAPIVLEEAAVFLDSALTAAGYQVTSLPYGEGRQRYRNLEVTVPGTSRGDEILVIGAHYDAVEGAPGADDNASGTAALLALARALAGRQFARTVRLVAFTNEEPPFFNGPDMGSRRYAGQARARGDRVVAMLSLETVGYFSDEPGSQRYPPPFNLIYPDRGNFVGFVGNLESRPLVRRAVATFRRQQRLPSEGVAAPALIPGIGWSDHSSFWLHGWKALMITDTAPFRNPHYHLRSDTPDRLDYSRMARLVTGLIAVVEDLANG